MAQSSPVCGTLYRRNRFYLIPAPEDECDRTEERPVFSMEFNTGTTAPRAPEPDQLSAPGPVPEQGSIQVGPTIDQGIQI